MTITIYWPRCDITRTRRNLTQSEINCLVTIISNYLDDDGSEDGCLITVT